MKILRPYLSAFLLLLMAFVFVTDNPLEKVIAGFKKYVEELPQEKVYLHFDRPYYSSGERIWFKAYVVAGAHHEPSPFSKTVYVDLISPNKKLIQQIKIYSEYGSVPGDFMLPDTLATGNYLIRAYTQWMKNFNEDYFFHRQVKIFNTSTPSVAESSTENKIDLQFFPEGGEWVIGFKSKLAFKAIGPDGLGRKVKGKIVDNSGQLVAEFQSNSLGMGACSFMPLKEKTYRAIVEQPNDISSHTMKSQRGIPITAEIPAAKDSGIILSLTNNPSQNEVVVKIQSTELNKNVFLVAQTRGIICYAAKVLVPNTLAFVKIPKANFPTGVAQVTILDEAGLPICERLTFVDHQKALQIVVKPDKETFGPREKVTLSIEAKDEEGKPIVGDFSLAVCDDNQVFIDENREDIYSNLYFASELKGHIESPGYYFNTENADRFEAMDFLLMTQGWRRLLYKTAMSDEWAKPIFQVEQGLKLKGKLSDKFNNKPIADGRIIYLSTYPLTEGRTTRTNAIGEFEISDLVYFDSTQLVLQGETKRGSKLVKIRMDSLPDSPPTDFPLPRLTGTLSSFETDFFRRRNEQKKIDRAFDQQSIMLETVEVEAKKEPPASLTTDRIYGIASKSVQVAGDPGLENLMHPLQLVQGRVAGVNVSGSGLNWSVSIRGVGSINAGTTPLILVDNIPVPIDVLASIPVKVIESYDVWKGPDTAIFGAQGANGVIAFYTKKGGGVPIVREGIYTLEKTGYQTPRQFYSPQYDVKIPAHAKPDRRITLYWAPAIRTDREGRVSIAFFNHDLETSVTCILEGMSTSGTPGMATGRYTIKK